jgi:ATP-binding cassette subfamily B (MDR/TAP) protein 1
VACKQLNQIIFPLFSSTSGLSNIFPIYSGLNQAATNFYSFEQGRIAAYRLYEMISRSTSSTNQEGSTLPLVQGNIEFRNVYFSYLSRPEIPILSGFFLTVPARKTVALVGRNGSGKSSIIPLMERFYDPTLGNTNKMHI